MSDIECPYCGTEQEINHDDGYGYDEDREYEQNCVDCRRPFKFTTAISYSYEVFCDGAHEMEQSPLTVGGKCLWSCGRCDYCELREVEPPAGREVVE